ncbi:MAG: AAA family ATPase [Acetobacter aceti]|uniref:Metallophosphoesterase n=1 Tax=Acetobacter aceti TaxID=435 RepID=A0A1U9KHJ5_ACEAC|nr:AAA family ATPase [Acetobacter aceti]AQS85228.1 metallophosphoesterase [Acetobacter aceti]
MGIIANIQLLQGMGIYSNRDSHSPSLNFCRYNLIYGFNGSGKSTLSRLFASLEAGRPHPKLPKHSTFEMVSDDGSTFGCPNNPTGLEQRLLVFNSDYIEQNLQWTVGRVNPVFYIGVDQTEAANELTSVEGEIIKAEAKKDAAGQTLKSLKNAFTIFKRERAKLIASRLYRAGRKYEAPAFAKDYEKWQADDRPLLTNEELRAAEDTRRLAEPMPPIQPLIFDEMNIGEAYRFIVKVCSQSLAMVALDEVKQYPDMLLWLKQGRDYHEAHGISDCLLCGNAFSVERRSLLAITLDDKVDRFIAHLTRTANRLSELIQTTTRLSSQLPASNDLMTELRTGFNDTREALLKDVSLLSEQLATLQAVLSAKQERPATPANMLCVAKEADVTATADRLAASVTAINEAITTHNKAITDFTKLKDAAETAIRQHFVTVYRDEYRRAEKDIKRAAENHKVATDTATALEEKAHRLRQKIRTHGPAADVINRLIAAYLGHSELTINPVDEGYELHRHGSPITGVPSEGEKTAIAISYFLSSINAENRKIQDLIVVVDDPVSSLDTKALNYACALVRTRLEKAAQVFILTHNLQCMNEFKKAWKGRVRPPPGKAPTAAFMFIDVTIPAGQTRRASTIIGMSKLLREYDSEYHFLFSHILRFTKQADAYDDHGYMIPNVIRRVLDVFLAFKCPGSSGLSSQLNTLCTDYPDLDREALTALERLAQVESHSDNVDDLLSFSSMTLEETKRAANALFTMIGKVDPKHLERVIRLFN